MATFVAVRLATTLVSPATPEHSAVAADPLDPEALADEGFMRAGRGEAASANAIIAFAGQRSWRDWRVQDRLLEQAARLGNWDAVMAHADALLRTDPHGVLQPSIFRLLNALASQPLPRAALVKRLAQQPWWRRNYLQRLGTTADGGVLPPDDADAILAGLTSTSAPALPEEYQPYLALLVAHGRFSEAIATWRRLSRRQDAFDLVREGDFAGPADGSNFTWRPASGPGVWSEIVHAGSSYAFHVAYDGFSSPVFPTQQLLVLAPGRYRLAWRERDSGSPRLAWRVRCAGQTQSVADAALAGAAGAAWTVRAMTFDIPAQACAAQWLELIALPGERRAEVEAWYAQMTLTAVS
jgi:hypothetical protein